ncbi:hypothetical protein GW17_00061271, partial [Ensete ventricosum]
TIPECGKVGSHLRTRGAEVGVAGLPLKPIVSRKGRLPQGCWVLSILTTSSLPSSAKMLLDDSSGSRGRHDVVRPAHARPAQRGAKLGEDMRRLLNSCHRGGGGIFFLVSRSDSCKKRPLSGVERWGEPPDEVPPMAKLALLMRVLLEHFSSVRVFYFSEVRMERVCQRTSA